MNLKEYREMPDEGLFEKVSRRLMVRRLARVGGVTAAAVVVVGAAIWLLTPSKAKDVAEMPMLQASVNEEIQGSALKKSNEDERTWQTVSPDRVVEPSVVANQPVVAVNAEERRISEHTHMKVTETVIEPVLPASKVISTDTPMAELIVESGHEGATQSPAQPKAGDPTIQTPHYENLLLAPTIIVPSADDEQNRQFGVLAATEISDFHMAIFNRAGRQMFSTNDITHKWDATSDGNPVPQGAYVWMARFRDAEGNPRTERGTVVVVR